MELLYRLAVLEQTEHILYCMYEQKPDHHNVTDSSESTFFASIFG